MLTGDTESIGVVLINRPFPLGYIKDWVDRRCFRQTSEIISLCWPWVGAGWQTVSGYAVHRSLSGWHSVCPT